MAFSIVLRLAAAAASLYMLLLMARIILTWFPSAVEGRPLHLLSSVTDPYLDLFRGIPWLSTGSMDFSPLAALAVLSVLTQILSTAAAYGRISLGIVLALVLRAGWSIFAFFFGFLGLAMAARLVAYMAKWNSLHPVWRVVDALINPVMFRLNRAIYRDRIVNFRQGLLTGIVVLFGLRILGGILTGLLAGLLSRLPF
ncbi:MAG TPA: YggT family protein [Spirochaetales bacterium]|nr:YggT family protein [Spirochaetales bacterium]